MHMDVTRTSYQVRQKSLGRFRRPEDGRQPYAHVNNQRLFSTLDQKKASVYANDKNIARLEKGMKNKTVKIFDTDAGMTYDTKKINNNNKQVKSIQQYDKSAKIQIMDKNEEKIDQWA